MIKNKFIVTIPVYNALPYISDCLESVNIQNYDNYEVVVIDDCSDDGTWEIIEEYGKLEKFHVFRNRERLHSPIGNIVAATQKSNCNDEDIIVNLDGDDRLSSDIVFPYLNWIYQNREIWATYGQYTSSQYTACSEIPNHRTYRRGGPIWRVGHLRTYKRWLFNLIKDEDLRDENGEYYKFAGDCALIYPIVEMCGPKHLKFIDKVVYIYNNDSCLNEWRVDKWKQMNTMNRIKAKDLYDELP